MNCPICHIELITRSIQDVQVDECEKCEGIWFDKDELRHVKDRSDSDLNWIDFDIWKHANRFKVSKEKHTCPKCGIQMKMLNYDDTSVEIDYCTDCGGIWLDKGELERIIQALEKELHSKSLGQYVNETVREAKEMLSGKESFVSEWKDFTTLLRLLQYRILSLNPKIHNGLVTFQDFPLNR